MLLLLLSLSPCSTLLSLSLSSHSLSLTSPPFPNSPPSLSPPEKKDTHHCTMLG